VLRPHGPRRGLALLLLACTAVAVTGIPRTAADATQRRPVGAVTFAHLNTFTNRLTVRGWAYDPGRLHRPVRVRLRTAHHVVVSARTNRSSPRLDRRRHVHGRHAFAVSIPWHRPAYAVRLLSSGVGRGRRVRLDSRRVKHVRPTPGERIVSIARRYVGNVPYRYGGSSPRSGFDCSGYVMYVYRHAHVRGLPHSAQQQRETRGMHPIRRSHARPGDLIFYLHDGYAYHVAIFAGHHREYAATEPGQRIRHQRIWSRNIVFKTDWH
jgi:cell wall-associated NlpC family hydrolase